MPAIPARRRRYRATDSASALARFRSRETRKPSTRPSRWEGPPAPASRSWSSSAVRPRRDLDSTHRSAISRHRRGHRAGTASRRNRSSPANLPLRAVPACVASDRSRRRDRRTGEEVARARRPEHPGARDPKTPGLREIPPGRPGRGGPRRWAGQEIDSALPGGLPRRGRQAPEAATRSGGTLASRRGRGGSWCEGEGHGPGAARTRRAGLLNQAPALPRRRTWTGAPRSARNS